MSWSIFHVKVNRIAERNILKKSITTYTENFQILVLLWRRDCSENVGTYLCTFFDRMVIHFFLVLSQF